MMGSPSVRLFLCYSCRLTDEEKKPTIVATSDSVLMARDLCVWMDLFSVTDFTLSINVV